MNAWFWVLVLVILNFPLFVWVGKLFFFSTMDDFLEAVKYTFTPDLVSWLFGEYLRDVWTSLKLSVFLLTYAGAIYVEYHLVKAIF